MPWIETGKRNPEKSGNYLAITEKHDAVQLTYSKTRNVWIGNSGEVKVTCWYERP